MTKHFAVMNETGEVIAQADSFTECQRKAYFSGKWADPNTGEIAPAGTVAPYHITTIKPESCAVKLRISQAEAERTINERD
jgi:hypothetical protein